MCFAVEEKLGYEVKVHNRYDVLSEVRQCSVGMVTEAGAKGEENVICSIVKPSGSVPGEKLIRITATVDSGSVDHVFPLETAKDVPLEPSPMSRRGGKYLSAAAGGEEMKNHGQRRLQFRTKEGQDRTTIVQVAPVRKPLLSAAKLNETGNIVVLDDEEAHIKNKRTGQITKLRKKGKEFVLDMWVKVNVDKKANHASDRKQTRFQRQ